MKEQIQKYLPQWGWSGSVDDILQYWFKAEHYVDQRFIENIVQLKEKGIGCYLATVQEKYRTEYMRNEMGFGKLFDDIFASAYIGYKKQQPEFWRAVMNSIPTKEKASVIIWDDEQEAIDAANKFGFDGYLYIGFEEYKNVMKKLIP